MKEYKTFNQQLSILLNKEYNKKFHSELNKIFSRYQNEFNTVDFNDILDIMGISLSELNKLN